MERGLYVEGEKRESSQGESVKSSGLPSFGETLIIECVAVVGSKALSVEDP